MRRQALQDGPRRVVLARDEVQRAGVALAIALDERVDLGVSGLERRRGPRRDGHAATVYFYNCPLDEQTQKGGLAQTSRQGQETRRERAHRRRRPPRLTVFPGGTPPGIPRRDPRGGSHCHSSSTRRASAASPRFLAAAAPA